MVTLSQTLEGVDIRVSYQVSFHPQPFPWVLSMSPTKTICLIFALSVKLFYDVCMMAYAESYALGRLKITCLYQRSPEHAKENDLKS